MSFATASAPLVRSAQRAGSVPFQAARALVLAPALAASAVMLKRRPEVAPVVTTDAPLWHVSGTGLELSVVVPFYNPGAALRPTIERMVSLLRQAEVTFEVIAVSDGSTDGSELTLDGVGDEVRVIVAPVNRGKGAALHLGFAQATGQYVAMIDADGDIDPTHLVEYLEEARNGGHDVVYASKRHARSQSASSAFRKLISYGFITLVTLLFALDVKDTQTGCKLFRREALARVLPRLREHRFAFDLEFFVAARAAGIRRLHAAPVRLEERLAGSTVSRSAVVRTLVDSLVVLGRLHLTPTYRTAPVIELPAAVAPAGLVIDLSDHALAA